MTIDALDEVNPKGFVCSVIPEDKCPLSAKLEGLIITEDNQLPKNGRKGNNYINSPLKSSGQEYESDSDNNKSDESDSDNNKSDGNEAENCGIEHNVKHKMAINNFVEKKCINKQDVQESDNINYHSNEETNTSDEENDSDLKDKKPGKTTYVDRGHSKNRKDYYSPRVNITSRPLPGSSNRQLSGGGLIFTNFSASSISAPLSYPTNEPQSPQSAMSPGPLSNVLPRGTDLDILANDSTSVQKCYGQFSFNGEFESLYNAQAGTSLTPFDEAFSSLCDGNIDRASANLYSNGYTSLENQSYHDYQDDNKFYQDFQVYQCSESESSAHDVIYRDSYSESCSDSSYEEQKCVSSEFDPDDVVKAINKVEADTANRPVDSSLLQPIIEDFIKIGCCIDGDRDWPSPSKLKHSVMESEKKLWEDLKLAEINFKKCLNPEIFQSQSLMINKHEDEELCKQDLEGDTPLMIVVCKKVSSKNFYENLFAFQQRLKDIKICCDLPVNNEIRCCSKCGNTNETIFYSPLSMKNEKGETALSCAVKFHQPNSEEVINFLCSGLALCPLDLERVFDGKSLNLFLECSKYYPLLRRFIW